MAVFGFLCLGRRLIPFPIPSTEFLSSSLDRFDLTFAGATGPSGVDSSDFGSSLFVARFPLVLSHRFSLSRRLSFPHLLTPSLLSSPL